MAVSIMQVARTLGQLSDWSLSNLELQKIGYIAEMLHLGRTAAPLTGEEWQAWDYGPVQPELYRKARVFGASPVKDIFIAPALSSGTVAYEAVADAHDAMKKMSAGQRLFGKSDLRDSPVS